MFINRSILSPGGENRVERTTMTGNLEQDSGATMLVDLDFAGNTADGMDIDGSARVAGTARIIYHNPASLLPGSYRHPLFATTGGAEDDGLVLDVAPSAVVDYRIYSPEPDELALGVDIDFSPEGLNRNLNAIGDYFNDVQTGGGSAAMAPVVVDLFEKPDLASLAAVYDEMNPDYHDAVTQGAVSMGRRDLTAFHNRLQGLRASGRGYADLAPSAVIGSGGPVRLAYLGNDSSLPLLLGQGEDEAGHGMWMNFYGQWGDENGDEVYDGFEFRSHSILTGWDTDMGRGGVLGLGFGISRGSVTVDGSVAENDIDTTMLSLYGSHDGRQGYFDWVASYAWHDFDSLRLTRVLGKPVTARSSHSGRGVSLYGETGLVREMSPSWRLLPFFALDYQNLKEDGYRESGADPLNLIVKERRTESLVSDLGLRNYWTADFETGRLAADLGIAFDYNYDIDDQLFDASFSGYPGASFTTEGREPESSGLLVSLGLSFLDRRGMRSTIRYQEEMRQGLRVHALMGGLRVDF